MSERQFDESEIGPILRRASELQAGASSGASGFTLGDIQRLASEVGIDPTMVERAAGELATTSATRIETERMTSILLDNTVEGVLDEEGWEEIVAALRLQTKRPGIIKQRGSTTEWSCRSDTGGLTFSATRRGNQTRLRLMGDLSTGFQSGWVVVPPVGIVGGIATGAILAKHGGGAFAVLIGFLVLIVVAIATSIGVFSWVRHVKGQMRALFEQATRAVRQDVEYVPTPIQQRGDEGVSQHIG